ncbi:MAG: nucleotidyl transferase AbiEii/AbiGii toxin family protein [Promicromonosporaceae bacterium]|nr:nucleotidyl transferase AbiEii/AbiGii toxin family protein [Promicromonosporaceae bacterium]
MPICAGAGTYEAAVSPGYGRCQLGAGLPRTAPVSHPGDTGCASARAGPSRRRISVDHDHVLADLRDRFDEVLDALEREHEWVTNRVTPGRIVLGELGGIETGVRQLIRLQPLEVELHHLPSGATLRVPTREETLRIKAFLIVRRNQVRDYLDVAALADRFGVSDSAATLRLIDDYYTDPRKSGVPVATQLAMQLASPQPADRQTIERLSQYKGLVPRWRDWEAIKQVCHELALEMVA